MFRIFSDESSKKDRNFKGLQVPKFRAGRSAPRSARGSPRNSRKERRESSTSCPRLALTNHLLAVSPCPVLQHGGHWPHLTQSVVLLHRDHGHPAARRPLTKITILRKRDCACGEAQNSKNSHALRKSKAAASTIMRGRPWQFAISVVSHQDMDKSVCNGPADSFVRANGSLLVTLFARQSFRPQARCDL